MTGPRQSGKTILIRAMYPDLPYYNLDRPDILERVREDPQGFLSSLKGKKAIIDEAHWNNSYLRDSTRPCMIGRSNLWTGSASIYRPTWSETLTSLHR
ncbi:MAG TPA: hypothetical protein PLG79_02395 [Spirochaetales bacterium]|nr:hypothetical protein [Spirochaetales bacterium]